MERRPEFTIIAGPNGAGKSRLCPFYVSATSFDGDKLMLNLRREHPDWPDRWVSGTVASELEKQKKEAQKQKIEQTAQAILDARSRYPDATLANIYDNLLVFPDVLTAHRDNDRAVMEAYGFDVKTMTESKCVAELFRIYQDLTK